MSETTSSTLWRYRNGVVPGEIVGYDVEAIDGHIGHVDDASTEASARRTIVVDTGFWIFGKKRCIPAGVIDRIDHNDRKVFVRMNKNDIKDAPDFDASIDDTETSGRYYGSYLWD